MKGRALSIIMFLVLSIGISAQAVEITTGGGKISAFDTPNVSTLVTALFREGRMTDIKLHPGSGTITAVPSEDFSEIRDFDTIKAFLWNMSTLEPLCHPVTTNNAELNNEDNKMTIKIDGQAFSAVLYDNETAKTFKKILPITIQMNELNGNEKYYYFNQSLPTNSTRPGTIHEGDLMLYSSDCLVLFYETFQSSYSYTKIGYIENTAGLSDVLGSGKVTVRYE